MIDAGRIGKLMELEGAPCCCLGPSLCPRVMNE